MKANKGFFLVGELICFCLTSVLLLAAARAYSACLRTQEYTLRLEESWQAAQLAAADQPVADKWHIVRQVSERQGVQLVEVQVYDELNRQPLCTLVQAAP